MTAVYSPVRLEIRTCLIRAVKVRNRLIITCQVLVPSVSIFGQIPGVYFIIIKSLCQGLPLCSLLILKYFYFISNVWVLINYIIKFNCLLFSDLIEGLIKLYSFNTSHSKI